MIAPAAKILLALGGVVVVAAVVWIGVRVARRRRAGVEREAQRQADDRRRAEAELDGLEAREAVDRKELEDVVADINSRIRSDGARPRGGNSTR